MEHEEELSPAQAAAALGVTERTLRAYEQRGLLVATRRRHGLAVRVRYERDAVERCRQALTAAHEGQTEE